MGDGSFCKREYDRYEVGSAVGNVSLNGYSGFSYRDRWVGIMGSTPDKTRSAADFARFVRMSAQQQRLEERRERGDRYQDLLFERTKNDR